MNGCRIAVLADLHYTPGAAGVRGLGDVLLNRALHMVADCDLADVVVLAGDLSETEAGLREVAAILAKAGLPWFAIPGNHDLPEDEFYRILPRVDRLDWGGVRIVPLMDWEIPGFHAHRPEANFARMAAARDDGFSGELAMIQHVPTVRPGLEICPYGYDNIDRIDEAMAAIGARTALAGHVHDGLATVYRSARGVGTGVAPALVEGRFAVAEVTPGQGIAAWRLYSLKLPECGDGWTDFHTHTPFAYCNENIDHNRMLQLMNFLGVARAMVTEHSSHLLFDRPDYRAKIWYREGMAAAKPEADRVGAYLAYESGLPSTRFACGTELDASQDGALVTSDELLAKTNFRLGAVHTLNHPLGDEGQSEYFRVASALIRSGRIHAFAHPFRVFCRAGTEEPPERYFEQLADLLRENKVALELNSHKNFPNEAFTQLCIRRGVKITLGSDTHNLYEIGYFFPQFSLLKRLGYSESDWREILLSSDTFFAPAQKIRKKPSTGMK